MPQNESKYELHEETSQNKFSHDTEERSALIKPTMIASLDEERNGTTMNISVQDDVFSNKSVDLDEIIQQIGEYSRYQIALSVVFSLFVIGLTPHTLLIVFYSIEPPWRCTDVGYNQGECLSNSTFGSFHEQYDTRCHMNRSSWMYLSDKKHSVVTEFDLVCDDSWWIPMINMVPFVGGIAGTFVTGILSDRFGRKPTFFVCFFALMAIVFIRAFLELFWLYVITGFCSGFFLSGFAMVYVLQLELVGQKWWSFASGIVLVAFSLGLCKLSLLAYLIPNWRKLTLVLSAPYFLLMLFWRMIPESIRWLQAKQKTKEAESILRRIARFNKRTYPDVKLKETEECEGGLKDLFCHKKRSMKLLLHGIIWCIYSIIYYGVNLSVGHLSGSIYINFAVISLLEIPATLFTAYSCDRFGRRKTIIWTTFATTVAMIGVSCISEKNFQPDLARLRVALGMLTKFFITAAFNGILLLSSESFPTIMRSRASHTLQIILLIGGTIAPWITIGVRTLHHRLPYPILTVLCFVSGVLAWFLQETKGKNVDKEFLEEKALDSMMEMKNESKHNVKEA